MVASKSSTTFGRQQPISIDSIADRSEMSGQRKPEASQNLFYLASRLDR